MSITIESAKRSEAEERVFHTFRLVRRIVSTLILSCLVALVISPAAFSAELAPAQISVSPFVGGGSTSAQNAIRSNSGLSVSADLPFKTAARTQIGPRIEAINSMLSTTYDGTSAVAATYDHRIFGGGLVFERALGAADSQDKSDGDTSIFGAVTVGKAYSKLVLDEATTRSFAQSSYSGITGDYLAAEAGLKIPIRDTFSINVGLGANMLTLSQDVVGVGERESVVDRAYLTSETENNAADLLPTRVVQKAYVAKAGFTFGF